MRGYLLPLKVVAAAGEVSEGRAWRRTPARRRRESPGLPSSVPAARRRRWRWREVGWGRRRREEEAEETQANLQIALGLRHQFLLPKRRGAGLLSAVPACFWAFFIRQAAKTRREQTTLPHLNGTISQVHHC